MYILCRCESIILHFIFVGEAQIHLDALREIILTYFFCFVSILYLLSINTTQSLIVSVYMLVHDKYIHKYFKRYICTSFMLSQTKYEEHNGLDNSRKLKSLRLFFFSFYLLRMMMMINLFISIFL